MREGRDDELGDMVLVGAAGVGVQVCAEGGVNGVEGASGGCAVEKGECLVVVAGEGERDDPGLAGFVELFGVGAGESPITRRYGTWGTLDR
ncbi:hypothetical protein [Thermomonospora umbrina]|uniref:hypothetical protein n=1 Tax=Thermomonospora umbrina TaxID=111806 RepID=UPI0011C0FB4E|nr:hypothetical protein [Thermomonospora umbrina]